MAGQVGFNKDFSKQVGTTVIDVDSVNPNNAIRIGAIAMLNTTAGNAYLQIFKTAAVNVTLGTTVPDDVIGLPASGGISFPVMSGGWYPGGAGFSIAGTTTRTGSTVALIDVFIIHGRYAV